jgi:3D (Asp-Asp-Asp) domain-containing protein
MNLKKFATAKNIILCAVIITALTAAAFIGNKDYKYDLNRFVPLSVAFFIPQENIPVKIVADNTVLLVEAGGTVEDAIKTAGVELGSEDIVSQPLDAELSEDTEIIINRVTKERQTYNQKISIPTEYIQDDTLLLGEIVVVSEGRTGNAIRAYTHTYVDGQLRDTDFEETVYSNEPKPRVIKIGTREQNLPEKMISELPIPDDFFLDENGVPTEYSKVLTGKGVAYSAYKGAKGASGGYCVPGTVAVNPNIIPYGTKMYIVSTDGKYVYGYAVANDTGTGLMDGYCLVDLYMDSYEQTCQWGAHEVNVYILE